MKKDLGRYVFIHVGSLSLVYSEEGGGEMECEWR